MLTREEAHVSDTPQHPTDPVSRDDPAHQSQISTFAKNSVPPTLKFPPENGILKFPNVVLGEGAEDRCGQTSERDAHPGVSTPSRSKDRLEGCGWVSCEERGRTLGSSWEDHLERMSCLRKLSAFTHGICLSLRMHCPCVGSHPYATLFLRLSNSACITLSRNAIVSRSTPLLYVCYPLTIPGAATQAV